MTLPGFGGSFDLAFSCVGGSCLLEADAAPEIGVAGAFPGSDFEITDVSQLIEVVKKLNQGDRRNTHV